MDDIDDSIDFGDNPDVGLGLDEVLLDNQAELDPEIEQIRERLKEMEREAQLIRNLHSEVEKQMTTVLNESSSAIPLTTEEKIEVDSRSVFVGNVDYGATAEQLEAHFHGCGAINRVTILCDRYSGRPKGFAYVEFADKESAQASLAMTDTLFRGRQIKVLEKRTNRPGMGNTRARRPYGRARVVYRYVYPNRQIGVGLAGFGISFIFFGVLFFFDKGLLAIGNILFISGLTFVIGIERTGRFFFQSHKIKGTVFFFSGIVIVLFGWPVVGMLVESYGFFSLFGGFIPTAVNFLRRIPIIGTILNLPGIRQVLPRDEI
ncbi:hypothetical protein D917_04908 [Trichinella nativa]|uniref:RRM domain-containing protein n=2 Tax=Trichinella nativa TaxID=6335 RepID=A0A1Y3EXW2_9BILA|nr:Polyadenylate-binding protein 2 [Trichinella sp. T8]OUC49961.1 hypothetical protein D917_04908 [Trichinella nativa]